MIAAPHQFSSLLAAHIFFLFCTITNPDVEIVKILLANGADPSKAATRSFGKFEEGDNACMC